MKKNTIVYAVLGLYFISLLTSLTMLFTKKPLITQKPRQTLAGLNPTPKQSIAVIEVVGPIQMGQSPSRFMSYDAQTIVKKLRSFGDRPEIKAVILRINSPGGSVAAVQEIYSEIMKQRKEKKKIIVASMSDVAASGGYYIASACDKIVADPGTLTGSIGVILELGNASELFRKIGVKMETIKSGKHKDSGSMFRTMTFEERKMFQALIDEAYSQFVDAIVAGRKMDKQKVLQLADGRIYIGSQALSLGLIDKLGNDQTAIELAKELANIKGEVRLVTENDPWERVLSMFGGVDSKLPFQDLVSKNKVRFEYMLE
ncbi:MAG: signal peptide peptidase SppA [Elusimicrobiota bacterium]